ncbi:SDR family NAD(P)-dependent oxidoreductase [Actinomadura sp. KC345]|uniref:SDR family NAD(P)-dependent oxidoreductase n=1 Tax=Actinomadura sp. KC345 TaxID=2530371 RepID=UPI0010493AF7|nr:SDR family NAD(P)-dependent oxidoreductase [Actinomadura sp. KC345]TDC58010.1 SDR family NAD(P)-dependent oxidoreductase [Actinomadura sp. KC345]
MRRTALVTGAASGLGALAARRLAAAAWDVVAVDVDAEGLARTALRSPNMHVRTCDVTDPEAVADVLAVSGPVQRVVHAAMISPAAPALEQPFGEIEDTLRTDVLGTVHVVRAALPGMLERGRGEMILCPVAVDRDSSPGSSPGSSAGAAASAAVAAYTEALWAEHGGQGVTFRCARAALGTPPRVVLDAIDRSLARPGGEPHVPLEDGGGPLRRLARRPSAGALAPR